MAGRQVRVHGRRLRQLAITLTVVLTAGAIYQRIGQWRDRRHFTPRGRLVAVGSPPFRMHLNCTGQGAPLVILDSGMGGFSLDWHLVQPEVARFTRVCSYDRAGHGWSEPARVADRTSSQIARELHDLLTAAGEPGPYILVGHSFGGFNVRMFYKAHPREVSAMVLVDAEHAGEGPRQEQIQKTLPPATQRAIETRAKRAAFWEPIRSAIQLHLGLDRLKLAINGTERQRELLFWDQQPAFIEAVEAENRLDGESAAQVQAAGGLGSLPLIVLTAGNPYEGDSDDDLLTPEQRKRKENVWIHELQLAYAWLSTNGRQIIVARSSHNMPDDRPDAIIAAIRELWDATRSRTPH